MVENPYYQLKLGKRILRFFPNKNPRNLFWHRDLQDRDVKLLFGSVELQYEDAIPKQMEKNTYYYIQNNTYHRVISNKPFLILIKENNV